MARIHVTTDQGVLVEQIDTDEWDLTKPAAATVLMQEILAAVTRAEEQEER